MSLNIQLFVWQPRRTDLDAARRRVIRILEGKADRYTRAYGHRFNVRCRANDITVVGTIGYDPATPARPSWIGDGVAGAACAGAVEADPSRDSLDPPERAEPPTLASMRATLLGPHVPPSAIAALRQAMLLPGRWSAAAWTSSETVVVNGAATGRSLWWTEGSDGCAVGSQAGPLLDLVDRPVVLDLDRAALSVALGYVAGWGSLYQGVRRLGPGERILLRSARPPIVDRPVTLDAALGARSVASYDDTVQAFADRVTELVRSELALSNNPRIGLSGGRDSRLLAAAAVHAGWHPTATTGGSAKSADVVLARQVASLLKLEHIAAADPRPSDTTEQRRVREETGGVGRGQPMTMDRLAAWVALSDGTAPVSLAWIFRDLSQPAPVSPAPPTETLTGLGGGTHRGAYFSGARDLDRAGSARRARRLALDLFSTRAPLRRPVRDILAVEIDATDGLDDVTMSLAEWLSRFNWRFRQNCHGSDTSERRDFSGWTWSPLMEVGLLSVSRAAPAASLASSRLMEDATVRLAPQLAGVAYDRTVVAPPPEWTMRLVARLGLFRQALQLRSRIQGEHRQPASAERTARLSALWDVLYFGPGDHVWPELIEARDLRRLLRAEPDGLVIKALAVPEFLMRPDSGRHRPDGVPFPTTTT